jgi:hypothetical protein
MTFIDFTATPFVPESRIFCDYWFQESYFVPGSFSVFFYLSEVKSLYIVKDITKCIFIFVLKYYLAQSVKCGLSQNVSNHLDCLT